MVGLAAIGVNRYLVRTQDALIQNNLPAIELASRIGASTEVVGSLAAAFVQADTSADLEQIATALQRTVLDIENGAQALAELSGPAAEVMQGVNANDIVVRMTANGHDELRLEDQIQRMVSAVAQDGARLDALIEAETDLARLRVTAGIADLYATPDIDPRPALDALADRYFFAFERLTELARMVDALRLQFQQVPRLTLLEDVQMAHDQLETGLTLAPRRLSAVTARGAGSWHAAGTAKKGAANRWLDRSVARKDQAADVDHARQRVAAAHHHRAFPKGTASA